MHILGLGSEFQLELSRVFLPGEFVFCFPTEPAPWPWANLSLLRAEWAFQPLLAAPTVPQSGPGGEMPLGTGTAPWAAGQLCPQPHQLLIISWAITCLEDLTTIFFPSLWPRLFSLLSYWALLTVLPSCSLFFEYNLQLRISCCRNLRLPGDKVPKTFSHPFLLFQAHFVRIDLEHIWSLFQTEPF